MNKFFYSGFLILLTLVFTGCNLTSSKEDKDTEEQIKMTIYPETGFATISGNDTFTEALLFSEENSSEKLTMANIITEGFDFGYQKGYLYHIRVLKTRMKNPPQDVSSVKYKFLDLLSAEKIITADYDTELILDIKPNTVKFTPGFPEPELDENGLPAVYDAFSATDASTGDWTIVPEIVDFNFEAGYTYRLRVKKEVTASPYSEKYTLLEILSKSAG